MTPARRRALPAVLVLIIVGALAVAVVHRRPDVPPSKRPTLLLLTTLPLLFGDDFSVRQSGSEALDKLETRYRVQPISTTSAAELAKGRLLLMAHPLGQAPEHLVALDEWVRRGGRVLLLADPVLDWPSKRPLGDPLRPPPSFIDTGLLGHWGLRLDAPDERGPQGRSLGGYEIVTSSPGALSGTCRISADRLVGDCRVGKGRAIVVADADFLDARDLGSGARHNLDGLLAELEGLGKE